VTSERPRATRPDPPVRPDKLCYVCLGPRPIPKGTWARADAETDAFCSVGCCRAFHGCSLPETIQSRGAVTRDVAA
jgi:hypothetical protein